VSSPQRIVIVLVALVFFALHVREMPRTLEDEDSINFALGVERFDVPAFRPHPPGYPIFIAMAKASTAAVGVIVPVWDRDRRAAAGLALWGLIGGTLAIFVLVRLWTAVGFSPWQACLSAIVAIASPLFWFTAARPMTDTAGLIAALMVQTGLISGLRTPLGEKTVMPRAWIWAAFGAGLIIGLRSQTIWLTGPLMLWCVIGLARRQRWRDLVVFLGAAIIGVLLWAVPLVWMTGFARYAETVNFQRAADLGGGIELLWRYPNWALLKTAMHRTFIEPWQTATLAKIVLGLALIGVVALVRRSGRTLALIAIAFIPYLVLHLLFQETVTLRYGLPLVVPIAALAVSAMMLAGLRVAVVGAAALAVVSVVLVQPRLEAYSSQGAPVFRAFQDMQRALPASGDRPQLMVHHQVWWGIQRVRDWYQPYWDVGPLPRPNPREWLTIVDRWTKGQRGTVWFLADITRTDLTQFDPRTTRLAGRYLLSPEIRQLVGGVRLDSLNWWILDQPGWALGRGWALTPEIAGMTGEDRSGPNLQPVDAFIRRQAGPVRVLVGGRRLRGGDGTIAVDVDGQPLTQFPISSWFVQWIDLPAGRIVSGPDPYARLTIRAVAVAPGRAVPDVALEQFDAAPADDVMYALASDWYELEHDPKTGEVWRWSSGKSTIEVRSSGQAVTLKLAGASPLKDFDRAPNVVVRAGDRELGRFSPSAAFEKTIEIPADALAASSGKLTVETDLTFSPAERFGGADTRRLGLKLREVSIQKR